LGVNVSEKVFEKFGSEYMKGDIVFYEGEKGETMYIIFKGKVKITKKSRDVETTLAVLSDGDFFGEMSIIDDYPRSATAIVEEDHTKLIVIDREVFESQIQTNPKIIMQILKKMSTRIRDTDKQIENLMLQDIVSRIVGTLKMIISKAPKDDEGYVFDYSELQKDISSRLALPIGKVMEVLEMLVRSRIAVSGDGKYIIREGEDLGKFMEYLELKERYTGA
jgi:CRP-like cAMP-binding protein